jgi:ferredoxin
MAKFRIEIKTEDCIGCGSCVSVCDNWELKGDKAHPKKAELEEMGCNKEAEEICPVQCIKIIKE